MSSDWSPLNGIEKKDSPFMQSVWCHKKKPFAFFGCLLVATLLLVATSFPASADTAADERRFIVLINELRSGEGLQPLIVDNELTVEARNWSEEMASKGSLEHSVDLAAGLTSDWSILGENVGVTNNSDVDALFAAFVQSPSHYQNLIDPDFAMVGVGVVYGPSGKLWTTHRFMSVDELTGSPIVPSPPPATIAPEVVATSTTAPHPVSESEPSLTPPPIPSTAG